LDASTRPTKLWRVTAWKLYSEQRKGVRSGLLGFAGTSDVPPLGDVGMRQRARQEYLSLGFLHWCHPVTMARQSQANKMLIKARQLGHYVGRKVQFIGWFITGRIISTKTGEPMEFFTFEDEGGLVETVFFPKIYERFCHILELNRIFLLSGKVEEDFGASTLTVDFVQRL